MSDTSGLPNTNSEGVPAEDQPERFEEDRGGAGSGSGDEGDRDAQAAEPAETEPGQAGNLTDPGEPAMSPEGGEDVPGTGTDQAEPPPAGFDPADHPSNPDLVARTEPPD